MNSVSVRNTAIQTIATIGGLKATQFLKKCIAGRVKRIGFGVCRTCHVTRWRAGGCKCVSCESCDRVGQLHENPAGESCPGIAEEGNKMRIFGRLLWIVAVWCALCGMRAQAQIVSQAEKGDAVFRNLVVLGITVGYISPFIGGITSTAGLTINFDILLLREKALVVALPLRFLTVHLMTKVICLHS